MVKIDSKTGFSLFEAALVMAIAAVFITVMASVFPHRVKPKAQAEAHGRFECFYDPENGTLKQRMVAQGSAGAVTDATASNYCEFMPNQFVRYLIIDAVGGGSGGGSKGGSAGVFSSSFFAVPMVKYRLYPGKGGNSCASDPCPAGTAGSNTLVEGYKDNNAGTPSEELMNAAGGAYGDSLVNKTVRDIETCRITKSSPLAYYDCGTSPRCELINDKIEISYCRRSDMYRTIQYSFHKPDDVKAEADGYNYDVIAGPDKPDNKCTQKVAGSNGKFIYYDVSVWRDWKKSPLFYNGIPSPCPNSSNDHLNDFDLPSLFQMEIIMKVALDIPNTGEDSDLYRFIRAMKYDGLIQSAKPGNGGAKNANGKGGAVVVMW